MSLQQIRVKQPLVLCMTNTVAANFTANGLLAVGASPLMSEALQDAEQLVGIANAVLLNIGTVHDASFQAMLAAGKAANDKGIPVVLDPVGVGASDYRRRVVEKILEDVKVACIRCNVGELAALAGVHWETRGVDSGEGEMDVIEVARLMAKAYNTIIFVTGYTDVLTDGVHVVEVTGGHEKITNVTATGCLLSALTAAACSLEGNRLQQLQALAADYQQVAAQACQYGIGTVQVEILNALEQLSMEAKS
ncbi:hydroxyethylthiazole kinase [Lysinibacillus sp. KU-BSD001]|uniref:hydroxyethylthiazole kinase n=1 Tax=Lysinibacillus sp. KU-BSD001 TaxID=3141328 RepID=UPI0036E5D2D4